MHEATFKMLHEPFNYQLLSKMDVWLPSSLKKNQRGAQALASQLCSVAEIQSLMCWMAGGRYMSFSQALWLLQAKDVRYKLAAQ